MLIHVVGTNPIGLLFAFHLNRLASHSVAFLVGTGLSKCASRRERICAENQLSKDFQSQIGWESIDHPTRRISPVRSSSRFLSAFRQRKPSRLSHDRIDSLIVATRALSAASLIARLRGRLTSSSTLVLLHDGIVIYDALVRDIFRDPSSRPHIVLASHTQDFSERGGNQPALGAVRFGIVPDSRNRDFERSMAASPDHYRRLDIFDITPATLQGYADTGYRSLRETVSALLELDQLNSQWVPISDIQSRLRRQLVVDSCVQSLTSLLSCRLSALLTHAPAQNIITAICREAAAIYTAQAMTVTDVGISGLHAHAAIPPGLHAKEMAFEVEQFCKADPHGVPPSDNRSGKKTGVEYLNGYLHNLGAQYGVSTPFISFLYNSMKARRKKASPVQQSKRQ